MQKDSKGYYRHDFTFEGVRYSVRAKDQKTLWRKVAEKEERLKSGIDRGSENTPVSKWFEDFLTTYKKPSVTERTYKQLESYVKNYIKPHVGAMRMKDVRTIDLQRILNMCEGKSISQTAKLRNLITSAFKQARIDRMIANDPAEGLRMPETTRGTHRAITDHERENILRLCETHRAGLWVLIMLYTGARPAETRTLKWDDVDLKNGIIYLESAKTDYGMRKVPIRPELEKALRSAQRRGEYVLFQPTTGLPHTKTSMRKMWESFRRGLDIQMGAKTFKRGIIPETSVIAKDLTPYCLRHTYGTDLQTAGVPINIAKDLMGHKDISITAKIYTHLSDEAFNSAANQIKNLDRLRKDNKIKTIV